jgi:nucleoid DNA-binding protein
MANESARTLSKGGLSVNKTQLINQVCRQTSCSKYAATQIVNCCFKMIKKNAKAGSGVTIAGFGKFWCAKNTGTSRTGTTRTYSTRNTSTKGTKGGRKQVNFKPAPRW